ncbi:asparagine synthase (glutamine-hydrolyzing) [Halovenus halobia]|uniref:asparagine synthase (glutamine-hydrolyzing) n=1 Tax=Halovenus halobia TaxID=3396622 RepID=UPI003F56A6CB
MCGIAGALGLANRAVLGRMLGCLEHRGPDGDGQFLLDDSSLMMGMRRLAIVDVDGGDQPITNEDGSVVVVFNGEIYNYEQLRRDLKANGHEFETDADTEVLVHLWEEHGTEMPTYLNGMFAFSIWDREQESLFLARDRLGIKPLYVTEGDGPFLWASEVKALLAAGVEPELDDHAVSNYFTLRYWSWPQSPFEKIKKLQPGTSLLITEEGRTEDQYWDLSPNPRTGSLGEHASILRSRLEDSIERRLMADVPLGAFLSGGLDSSSIVAIMSELRDDPIDTFSIGFEAESFDESEQAQHVADHFGTNHHEITVDLESMDIFGDVIRQFGEPLADPAVLPTMALSEYASQELKVVLSGEGADELFGGYWYFDEIPRHQRMFDWLPKHAFRLAKRLEPYAPLRKQTLRYVSALESNERAILGVAQRFQIPIERYTEIDSDPERSGLLDAIRSTEQYTQKNEFYKRMLAFDIKYWLPDDLLYKVDSTSMAASLEARVPFLDHSLVEFGYNLPSEQKQNGYKPILKRAMQDILPEQTLQREKHGLGVPISDWFRRDHEAILQWMTESKIGATPYLDTEEVFRIWNDHKSGDDYGLTLWKILNFVAWYHTIVQEYENGERNAIETVATD